MVFNIQQFWQISVKLSLSSTIAFPNYFVPYSSSKNGIIFLFDQWIASLYDVDGSISKTIDEKCMFMNKFHPWAMN